MRVIAGTLGGRNFDSPHGHRTHPMSDKMRGALFNALGDIDGLTVLDAFAGTGALSFEALSRGAAQALAIEQDHAAQLIIAANLKNLGLNGKIKLVKANASGWSDNNLATQFDLILADPPYDHLQPELLQKLIRHLAPAGTYVLSWPSQQAVPKLAGLQQISQKSYGDSQLVFYKHGSPL